MGDSIAFKLLLLVIRIAGAINDVSTTLMQLWNAIAAHFQCTNRTINCNTQGPSNCHKLLMQQHVIHLPAPWPADGCSNNLHEERRGGGGLGAGHSTELADAATRVLVVLKGL